MDQQNNKRIIEQNGTFESTLSQPVINNVLLRIMRGCMLSAGDYGGWFTPPTMLTALGSD